MILEDQVCSLELAKKLKELGVKQDSLFVWEYFDDRCHGVKFIPYAVVPHESNNCKLYSAFTVSELGEMLPDWICTYRNKNLYFCAWNEDIWKLSGKFKKDDCHTEADARAKMFIYLIENNLIKVES